MSKKGKHETMQPVCMECGEEFSEDVARRSLTWWMGMAGVRAKLCSTECRDAFDARPSPTGDSE